MGTFEINNSSVEGYISLFWSDSEIGACAEENTGGFIIDGTFETTTTLTETDGGGNAPLGYYSDGSVVRYWNGNSFLTTQNC